MLKVCDSLGTTLDSVVPLLFPVMVALVEVSTGTSISTELNLT